MYSKKNDINDVLRNLIEYFQVSTLNDLAKKLNVKPNTISSWKIRGNIPEKTLIEIAELNGIRLEALLYGDLRTNNENSQGKIEEQGKADMSKTNGFIQNNGNVHNSNQIGQAVINKSQEENSPTISFDMTEDRILKNTNDDICELLSKYATKGLLKQLREKLLKIKEIEEN